MNSPVLFSSPGSRFLPKWFLVLLRPTAVLPFVILSLGMPRGTEADPVTVTSGVIQLDIEGDSFTFRGANFAISSGGATGLFLPRRFDPSCFQCRPGDIVDLGFQTIGGHQPAGFGPATFGGVTYPELFYQADLNVMADGHRFPDTTETVQINQPFVFEGSIRAFGDAGFSSLVFSTLLRGRGRAHTLFFFDPDTNAHFPEEGQIVYDFDAAQPVPEPAAIVLLGSGLCGVAARRWQQKRRT